MELRTDARANRARLIEAATEIFAQKGPAAEIKEIAEHAGLAIGTIYRHFLSKDALMTAIAHDGISAFVAGARAAAAEPDAIAALHTRLAHAYGLVDRYGWVSEALMTGQLPPATRESIHAELAEAGVLARFQHLVQRGVDQGCLHADLDVPLAAALLEGTILPWNYQRFCAGRTPEEAATAVVETFLCGAARRDRP
jgi:AcrR family transcriptional regulator